ncbi:MAG: S41 family peptidase [Lachnospiraceae bacterium]|nr:S41 family peptidase [Lachnospiraceae bacterium]
MEKKLFLKGLICGVLLTVFLVGGFYFAKRLIFNRDPDGIISSENQTPKTFEEKAMKQIETLRNSINNSFLYEVDDEEMLAEISRGIMKSLGDPYSVYYTAEEYDEMMNQSNGTYYGIGVSVSPKNEKDYTGCKVVRAFKGSPAEEAGIQAGDIFLKIAGTDVTDMNLADAAALIRGQLDSYVDLVILRDGKEIEFHIQRRKIEVDTVAGRMVTDNIGYIYVAEFDSVTSAQFNRAFDDLRSQGMEKLIVDLRENPGGLVRTAVEMCDKFLDDGMVVYTKDKQGRVNEYRSKTDADETLPMVVLVNGNSASASEIYAGAMQARGRAKLVGTTTFGKGIVQGVFNLPGQKDGIKITISSYFTPADVCIHGIGIKPDIEVELSEDYKNKKNPTDEDDNQLQAAIQELMKTP